MGIFSAASFAIFSTTNGIKGYSPGQLLFGSDKILPIKHMVRWKLIRQWKQTKINKYNICKNRNRVYHDHKVGDKFMITNNSAYKYETPHNGPFVITRCWTNGTVSIQYDPIKLGIIYIRLKHINLIQKLKISTPKTCVTISTYNHQLYTFVL